MTTVSGRSPVITTREKIEMGTCDRCSANGMVLLRQRDASLSGQRGVLDLVFCGHHYARNEVELSMAGFTVVTDNRKSLTGAGAA